MDDRLARCPRAARKCILSTFSGLCERQLGSRPLGGHPSAADLLWRVSGGRLPKILSRCERVVAEAAAQGLSDVNLGTVVARWRA